MSIVLALWPDLASIVAQATLHIEHICTRIEEEPLNIEWVLLTGRWTYCAYSLYFPFLV